MNIANKDKIQFLYNKINIASLDFDKKEMDLNLNIKNMDLSINKKSDLSFIEKACLNDFNDNHVNVKNVEIISSLNIKNNIYVPVYQSNILYNNVNYYNTIIAYTSINDGNNNVCCFNFPKISAESYIAISSKYIFLNIISIFLKIICLIPILVVLYFNIFVSINFLLIATCLFLCSVVILYPFNFVKKVGREKNLYLNSDTVSNEKFYDELVSSKNNYIGHVGR